MSETDDTDVLLLIPPNFFLVNSSGSEDSLLESSRTVVHKPASCTAQVLGKLVDQVQTLESRLSSLEINTTSDTVSTSCSHANKKYWDTTDSFDSNSLECKYFTFPRRRRRKNSKRDRRDLSLTSLDTPTTPVKNIPRLKLKENFYTAPLKHPDINDTRSMDGDISSIVSTPNKKNDKLLLHEIDEFLTKVEAYESPNNKYKEQGLSLSPENVIKATGDYISDKLDSKSGIDEVKLPSGRIVTSSILEKYIYLVKNQSSSCQTDKSVAITQKTTPNNDKQNVPRTDLVTMNDSQLVKTDTKSPSIRRLNFSDSKDVQPTSTPKKLPSTRNVDTFRPTSNKIYDRATKVLEQYKAQNLSRAGHSSTNEPSYFNSPKKDEFKMPQMRPYNAENRESLKLTAMQNKLFDSIDTELLSLSDLWGEKGDRAERSESLKLEEERLKREHCEAMIQQLQKKVLDQQEKLAVAMKVDRTKDTAISKLKEAWLKITNSLDRVEERHRSALEKMVREVENFKMVADDAQKKTNHFEAELYKALDLAHDYQEKCKQLSTEKKQLEEGMERAVDSQREMIGNKEKEIELLKENYDTVMKLNKQSTDCVKNLEEALDKEKSDHERTKSRISELNHRMESNNEEMTLILQEKDLLKAKVNEERARANMLERQSTDWQNQTSDLRNRCESLDNEVKALRKHLELQKTELKLHYQKQLEDAVLAKLQEFQLQLQRAEREVEDDARQKEVAIVDTYNKQIAKIEDQHKLEVNVLEEKQKEEINLYRLQLCQASEKIGLLENKLESYRRRRGQIASQLHSVMESQWRQALHILTNGNNVSSLDLTRPDTASSVAPAEYAMRAGPGGAVRVGGAGGRGDAGGGAPALAARLNFDALSDSELQQYLKLMLTKPASLDVGAGEGEARGPHDEPTSDRADRPERRDRRRSLAGKPPWKA